MGVMPMPIFHFYSYSYSYSYYYYYYYYYYHSFWIITTLRFIFNFRWRWFGWWFRWQWQCYYLLQIIALESIIHKTINKSMDGPMKKIICMWMFGGFMLYNYSINIECIPLLVWGDRTLSAIGIIWLCLWESHQWDNMVTADARKS